ncbi:MAG: Fe-S cluster assembly protein SufD [Rhodospirillales bacterium]|nr:Fe-S cluster assembly protein SufD [Rhodospirillales bacterium]
MSNVQTATEISPASRALVQMRGDGAELPGSALPWLAKVREDALQRFGQSGLPTPKLEDWKYTDLKALNGAAFARPEGVKAASELAAQLDADYRLVFVNGHLSPEHSSLDGLPKGLALLPLSEALATMPEILEPLMATDGGVMGDLNAAYIDEGAVIVAEGALSSIAIEYHMTGDGGDMAHVHPRNIVLMRPGANVTLIERHSGAAKASYFANHVTLIQLEDGAALNHVKLFADPAKAFNTSLTNVTVGRDACYRSALVGVGAQLLRNEIRIQLAAPGAEAHLAGAYLARATQHSDHTTRIDHLAPHTTSRQIFRGALDGKSRAVFQGNIVVAEGADGADGRLANNTLLLSEGCEIASKPQLEIYAEDVKCAHGSTVGELDEDAMFYLRSRGIPEIEARALLVEGFLSEVFDGLDEIAGVAGLVEKVSEWLADGGSAK